MTFKCSKCSKETEWYGSIKFPSHLDHNFCNECGNKLIDLLENSEKRIFNDFIHTESHQSEDDKVEEVCGC